MEWTRKHQNLTSASDNAVFRSSVNKDEQDLPVTKKSNTSEDCNSERRLQLRREARKRREQSLRAEETSQEAQKRLKDQRQRDTSRRQMFLISIATQKEMFF